MIAKRVPWATIPATLDAILMDQSATGRIDPLLIAETAKEMLGNLDFGEPQFTGYERQDVVCKRQGGKNTRSGSQWQDQAGQELRHRRNLRPIYEECVVQHAKKGRPKPTPPARSPDVHINDG